ncbi:hypothetical protein [Actinoplanes sp. NBRC 103695]|uniref:hypothetical protein n=1 Tax=Actinoplanes sp. NBRC 103695 TaxID=3032202 RepID=UPI0024A39780|nr:hypothetical protein [Actinoplanes sp. NBRC 103695]GLZ02483.1 hypothetical protein Acsp02_97340 [Actinoplanes sp. NBRC 103695]
MSDLNKLMDALYFDLAAVRWPSGDELRRRVRRRRARTTAAVAVAVITVSVGIASLAGFRDDPALPPAGPSPTAPAPRPPAPPEIPRSVLLRAAEIGTGLRTQYDKPDAHTPVRLVDAIEFCPEVTPPSRPPRFVIGVTHMIGSKNPPPIPFVLGQSVYRFGGTDADGFLRDLRSAVATCGTRTTTGDGMVDGKMMRVTVTRVWSISDDRFTSDDALVIRQDINSRDATTARPLTSGTELVAYVRTGDLVTRISMKKDTPLTELRRLAALAGARLCAAAQPGC